MLDGLEGCWGNHQGLFYIPEIIKTELTSHFGIEKLSKTRCQKEPAVATEPSIDLDVQYCQ